MYHPARSLSSSTYLSTEMNESIHCFGAESQLQGIITSPKRRRQPGLACLLSNAGLLPRIGPHRINVKLARALAAEGVPTLRMDLAGLGDSLPSRTAHLPGRGAVADLQEGLDLLERETAATRFVVVGICSGARHALALARADRRVAGVLMFDGYAYPTLRTQVLRRWERLRRTPLRTVPMMAVLSVLRILATLVAKHSEDDIGTGLTKEAFRRQMDAIVERGVSPFIIYSGSILETYNYEGQLADAFEGSAFLGRARYAYLPHIDHTLTTIDGQREFLDRTVSWVLDLVPTPSSGGDTAVSRA